MFELQASQDKKSVDVGANLFIGNLDPVRKYFTSVNSFMFYESIFFSTCLKCPKYIYSWAMYLRFFADQLLTGLMFYFLQDVDEKLLYDTFTAFGVIVANPKVSLTLFFILLFCVFTSITFGEW